MAENSANKTNHPVFFFFVTNLKIRDAAQENIIGITNQIMFSKKNIQSRFIFQKPLVERWDGFTQWIPSALQLTSYETIQNHAPATFISASRMDPVCFEPRTSTSLPISVTFKNMSRRFPAMVISSTGY